MFFKYIDLFDIINIFPFNSLEYHRGMVNLFIMFRFM